jgi:hypothetical protein
MENKAQVSEAKNAKKISKGGVKHASIRIKSSSKKLASSLRDEANQKTAGRTIKMEEIFELALSLMTKEHLKMLQERSLSHEDRKELLRQRYIELRGPISKDSFIGFLMSADFPEFMREQNCSLVCAESAVSPVAKAG